METKFKTNILLGTLGAAVLCAGGYGLYLESKRTTALGPGGRTQDLVAPAAASDAGPGLAVLRIETLPVTTANSAGHEARVFGKSGLHFEWSIQGGTLDSDNQRETVLWTAGPSGNVILTCRAFDAAAMESVAAVRIPIQSAPTISGFEAVPSVLTLGSSAKLGWTVKDCRKLVLDPGGRDVTAFTGPGFDVQPTETTTYTLTATDAIGTTTTRDLTLKVVPPPEIGSLRAEAKPGSPNSFTVIGEFKGGKAELKGGDAVLASGNTSPLQAELSGVKAGASVSLVVTNEAGASVTSTVQFSIKK